MSRKRKGTVAWKKDHWAIRITVRSTPLVRPWFHCEPSVTKTQARAHAKLLNEMAAKGTLPLLREVFPNGIDGQPNNNVSIPLCLGSPEPDTVARGAKVQLVRNYAERWLEHRKNLGCVKGDRHCLNKWVLPQLGDRPVAGEGQIEANDLRRVVQGLDKAIDEHRIGGPYAQRVWDIARKMFRDTTRSKKEDLRVRSTDPTADVEPPDRGIRKSKGFLYPDEFLALVSTTSSPLGWRRAVAIEVYQHLRPGELEALEWEDMDLEHKSVNIHRAINRTDGTVKATKSNYPRRMDIEDHLLPMLYAMKAEAAARNGGKPTGRVVELPPYLELSPRLRECLQNAGVDRGELFANDETRKNMTFYDLRATGITWRVVRGDSHLEIMQDAGHRDFKTTQRYIRLAEAVKRGFGEPFPVLPLELACPGGPVRHSDSSQESSQGGGSKDQMSVNSGTCEETKKRQRYFEERSDEAARRSERIGDFMRVSNRLVL